MKNYSVRIWGRFETLEIILVIGTIIFLGLLPIQWKSTELLTNKENLRTWLILWQPDEAASIRNWNLGTFKLWMSSIKSPHLELGPSKVHFRNKYEFSYTTNTVSIRWFLNKLNIELPHDPANPLLDIYSQ